MKTKLIFFALAGLIFQTKNVFAVENTVEAVEKEYQHELICQASTENENFELNFKWEILYMHIPDGRAPQVKKEFAYELKNLTTGQVLKGHYGGYFVGHANIVSDSDSLHAVGSYMFYKRLGYRRDKTDILLSHDGAGGYALKNFIYKSVDSIENPDDFCNPPTRLCGAEPPFPQDSFVVSLTFVSSACELKY